MATTDNAPEQTPEQILVDAVTDYIGALGQPELDALIAGARPPADKPAAGAQSTGKNSRTTRVPGEVGAQLKKRFGVDYKGSQR